MVRNYKKVKKRVWLEPMPGMLRLTAFYPREDVEWLRKVRDARPDLGTQSQVLRDALRAYLGRIVMREEVLYDDGKKGV